MLGNIGMGPRVKPEDDSGGGARGQLPFNLSDPHIVLKARLRHDGEVGCGADAVYFSFRP